MSGNAYYLARHMSNRSEFNVPQEGTTPPSSPMTEKSCFAILSSVCPDHPLPDECQQFNQVKEALQRRNSNPSSQAIAFQGMNPGEAVSAMAARDKGNLHHAQIQRRMTSGGKQKRIW